MFVLLIVGIFYPSMQAQTSQEYHYYWSRQNEFLHNAFLGYDQLAVIAFLWIYSRRADYRCYRLDTEKALVDQRLNFSVFCYYSFLNIDGRRLIVRHYSLPCLCQNTCNGSRNQGPYLDS